MRVAWVCIGLLVLFVVGCGSPEKEVVVDENLGVAIPDAGLGGAEAGIVTTNLTEEVIAKLEPKLRRLAGSFASPAEDLSSLFAESFSYQGASLPELSEAQIADLQTGAESVIKVVGPIDEQVSTLIAAEAAEKIWANVAVAGKRAVIEDSGFGVIEGKILEGGSRFHMKTQFEGRIRDDINFEYGILAKQSIDWQKFDGDWKIANWQQDSFKVSVAPSTLFENVTEAAFPETVSDEFAVARHSDLILERANDGELPARMGKLFKYFVDWNSMFRYTSCSVVDLDRDGWDDLFVADRWGKAKMLRNTGDGRFEDVSRTCGLRMNKVFINCTLFVDFDNDGDSDALLGQSTGETLFYRNEGGKFVRDDKVIRYMGEFQFVTCASAVDINRDGLMDVYLSTYCTGGSADFGWLSHAVPIAQLKELRERASSSHSYLDRCGPPNIVLMNRGGNLEQVRADDTLKQWKCSYQSVWSDVDDDGDSDLYICNDFAPDVLLRNDTPRGSFEPVFTDISNDSFEGGEMGFGMGASFGDYDSDGDLDLYVSNMYSKAGNRIFRSLGSDVSQPIFLAAQGNFLFEKNGSKFK
ncbi:MAG: VCBS repeat-containing protein, partial [Planctomycetota bacterium]